jgi:hypothetical protein
MEATYTFQGHHLRLDQIQTIEPIHTTHKNIGGFFSIFMKPKKWDMQSQYNFAIWFVGKNGGYREFYSKVIDYVGVENFKGDQKFLDDYEGLVFAWKEYHNKQIS